MSFTFTKIKLPIEEFEEKLSELSDSSGSVVQFHIQQLESRDRPDFNSVQTDVSLIYNIYVTNYKNTKFKYILFNIRYGLKPYPLRLGYSKDILKNSSFGIINETYSMYIIEITSADELKTFFDELFNDPDFIDIMNSIYSM